MIGRYKVVGRRNYRGHKPGSTFEVLLDERVEERAIARGDISLVGRIAPGLRPGSFTFPRGWLAPADLIRPGGRESGLNRSRR